MKKPANERAYARQRRLKKAPAFTLCRFCKRPAVDQLGPIPVCAKHERLLNR